MNLVYTIINLIVLFLLLRHFLIKPVSDIMEKRRQMIADGLQSAQDAQNDAQKMKQEYEDALKGAKLESAAIVDKARSEAKTEYDRIVSEAGSKAGDLLEAAKENVRIEREKRKQGCNFECYEKLLTKCRKIIPNFNLIKFSDINYDFCSKIAGIFAKYNGFKGTAKAFRAILGRASKDIPV